MTYRKYSNTFRGPMYLCDFLNPPNVLLFPFATLCVCVCSATVCWDHRSGRKNRRGPLILINECDFLFASLVLQSLPSGIAEKG